MKNLSNALTVKNINNMQVISNTLLDKFIRFADVSNNSIYTYAKGIRQFINFIDNMHIAQPTRDNVIEFKKYLEHTKHSANTIATYLTAIRKFFTWTESAGLYPNITVGVKTPRQPKGFKKDAFSGSQIKEVMTTINTNSLEGLRNFAMIGLITTAGLRTIEIVRANVEDLRLNTGQWVLYVQGKGRTDKGEFVHVTSKVLKAIRAYLKARGNVKPSEPLFVSHSRRNRGGRLTTRTVSGVCKNAMIAAGYISSRLTAHSLRHTAITLALIAGQSLQDVQAFARHSSISTTTIYAHNVSRLNSQCEHLIERAIF